MATYNIDTKEIKGSKNKKGKLIKVITLYNIKQAVDCMWDNNLLFDFEKEVLRISEGANIEKTIKKNNITLEQLVDFLNKHAKEKERYVTGK